MTLDDGLRVLTTRRIASGEHGAGAGGMECFVLALGHFQRAEAHFALRALGNDEPAEVRILLLSRT